MAENSLTWNFIGKDKISKVARGIGESFGSIGKMAAVGLGGLAVGGVVALTGALYSGVKAAIDYQTLNLKTAAVIRSTGNVAHVSVEGIDALASSLESMSGIDETLIINSQNVLLTFTRVRNEAGKGNDIFDQATTAALNMSVALGTDLQSSTIALGKALQDPVKGVTALRRVGVMLTDQQSAQIKKMIESGDVMGAQKVILKELSTEFGGAAKAAGSGLAGSLARLKDAFDDTMRSVGQALLPVLTTAASWLADRMPAAMAVTQRVLVSFGSVLGSTLLPALRALVAYLGPPISAAVGQFMAGVGALLPKLEGLARQLGPILLPILAGVAKAVGYVWGFIATQLAPAIMNVVSIVLPYLQRGLAQVRIAFENNREGIDKVVTALKVTWEFIRTYVLPILANVVGFLVQVLGYALRLIINIIFGALVPTLEKLVQALRLVWTVGSYVVVSLIQSFTEAKNVLVTVWNAIAGAASATWDRIRAIWNGAGGWFRSLGSSMINGIHDGWNAAIGAIGGWVGDIGNKIVNAVKGFFGIHSPSTVFAGLGRNMLEGLIKGLASTNPLDIARKALGGLPEALGAMVNKGWVKIEQLPGKALDALTGLGSKVGGLVGGLFKSGSGGGPGVEKWRSVAQAALAYTNSPPNWIDALLRRMNQESGGNQYAINLTDINAQHGDPSRGLMQTIGSTFNAYARELAGRGIYDPFANIVASIRYANARYGQAIFGWNRPGGYDSGGYLMPGWTAAYNGTGRPEMVLTEADRQRLSSGGGDVFVRVFIGDTELTGLVRTEVERHDTRSARAATARRSGR